MGDAKIGLLFIQFMEFVSGHIHISQYLREKTGANGFAGVEGNNGNSAV